MVATFPRQKCCLLPYGRSSKSTEDMLSCLDSPHLYLSFPASLHSHNGELFSAGATEAWVVVPQCPVLLHLHSVNYFPQIVPDLLWYPGGQVVQERWGAGCNHHRVAIEETVAKLTSLTVLKMSNTRCQECSY